MTCIRMAGISNMDFIFMMNMGDSNRGIHKSRNIKNKEHDHASPEGYGSSGSTISYRGYTNYHQAKDTYFKMVKLLSCKPAIRLRFPSPIFAMRSAKIMDDPSKTY